MTHWAFTPDHFTDRDVLLRSLAEAHRPVIAANTSSWAGPGEYRIWCAPCDGPTSWWEWRHGTPEPRLCAFWTAARDLGVVTGPDFAALGPDADETCAHIGAEIEEATAVYRATPEGIASRAYFNSLI